jgi:hypothetical protein
MRIEKSQNLQDNSVDKDALADVFLPLSLSEMESVVGGMMANSKLGGSASLMGGCTGGTRSVCHIDGTDDADSLF